MNKTPIFIVRLIVYKKMHQLLLNDIYNRHNSVSGLCAYLKKIWNNETLFLNLFISDTPFMYPELNKKSEEAGIEFKIYWFKDNQEREKWLLNTINQMENELKSKSLLGKIKLCLRRS